MQKYLSKNGTIRSLAKSIAASALLVFCFPIFGFAAYSEPWSTYPVYSARQIPDLLNSSSDSQTMTGNLFIGKYNAITSTCDLSVLPSDPLYSTKRAGCSRLCLNAPLIDGTYPNTNDTGTTINSTCITSWKDLKGLIVTSSDFIRKISAPTNTDTGGPDDDVDNGAFSLQASGYNPLLMTGPLISLMAEAPMSALPPSTLFPTAISADGSGNSIYAATFAGRLAVISDAQAGRTGKICLNEDGIGVDCLTNWSDITASIDPTIVTLQPVNAAAYRYPDAGNTAVSGILVTKTLVIGSPEVTTPRSVTCGNGMCDVINGETSITCSTDCD